MTTETVELEAELERISDALDEATDRLAEMDSSTEAYDAVDERASRLETHRRAVEWVREEWDLDEVTFRALTIGDDARLADEANTDGQRRVWKLALGTAEAPYVEHDPDAISGEELEATVANVASLPSIAYARWATSKIDEVSTVGNPTGEGSYASLLTEKRASATSTTE